MKCQTAKALLQGAIQDLTDCKWFFSRNPQADFSRKRKLSFEQMVQAILCMRGGSLANEMMDFFGIREELATTSAFVQQEIFARLTMYNFYELITQSVVIQQNGKKLAYKVNFSAAVHVCRQFFLGEIPPPLVEALLAKHISPIRPGRSRPRKLKPKQALSFLYRIA